MTSGQDDELRLHVHHLAQMNICRKGTRRMCKRLGIDWDKVRFTGVPLSELEGIDDAVVKRCIEFVRKEHGRQK